jgi:methylthioribose-1-phosphate isomerase
MKVGKEQYRTIWLAADGQTVRVIDQRELPFQFVIRDLRTVDDAAYAIREMVVRGAGLIGATAGYGMYLSALGLSSSAERPLKALRAAGEKLIATRPTAVNLSWAVGRQLSALSNEMTSKAAVEVTRATAAKIADEDVACCRSIGMHGVELIRAIGRQKGGAPVNILTHCNAGWLAFVDFGSATAPIYQAAQEGIPVHIWVDETRPRNQGARLTAWELAQQSIPHSVIVDNAGGHLMQRGLVDLVITGTDRTTVTGDVANKIGTYLKALAARDNQIPFYVALPSSTFDWAIRDGVKLIPIEERDPTEITVLSGLDSQGAIADITIVSPGSPARNYAFDVTPARLVTGLITERGICEANEAGIRQLFPAPWNTTP